MESLTIIEVVKKLVGEIEPQGETNIDNIRFDNLKMLSEVVEYFEYKIYEVSRHKDRQEYSMKRAGEFAENFIKETVDYYKQENL